MGIIVRPARALSWVNIPWLIGFTHNGAGNRKGIVIPIKNSAIPMRILLKFN